MAVPSSFSTLKAMITISLDAARRVDDHLLARRSEPAGVVFAVRR
jgi:hypothetical protein